MEHYGMWRMMWLLGYMGASRKEEGGSQAQFQLFPRAQLPTFAHDQIPSTVVLLFFLQEKFEAEHFVKILKESSCKLGDPSLILRLGRSPGGGNGNPPQYFCLGNPMDRELGGLQSMGLQRVGHDWVINTFTFHFCVHVYACSVTLVAHQALLSMRILQARILDWLQCSPSGICPTQD